ncbi:hypothetical protein ACSBR1_028120 [Camellia fascicularis]
MSPNLGHSTLKSFENKPTKWLISLPITTRTLSPIQFSAKFNLAISEPVSRKPLLSTRTV